jgi:hypothetical protein
MNRLALVVVACVLCTILIAAAAAAPKGPATDRKVDPATATLAEAVGDWIDLLELDDARASQRAADRWAADEQAAKDLRRLWSQSQDRHATFDYRTWIKGGTDRPTPQAEEIGDADTFTVGGHDFGHLHTRWRKTAKGWRIARAFECR